MVFCGLILVEPDLGTAIAIVAMLAAILLVSGTPTRTLAGGLGIATTLGLFAVNDLGLNGAVLQMVNHGLI